VLVVDETGDCKKGEQTVGVARQDTGTSGKIDNAQVAVCLTYASRHGHAIIDRELYLPKGWIADADRRASAGVPEQVGLATKPELARRMLERALDAAVPAAWMTADEVYGGNRRLRSWLETHHRPYVLAIKRTERLTPPGKPPIPAQELTGQVPPERWLRISAGDGAKGRRCTPGCECPDHHQRTCRVRPLAAGPPPPAHRELAFSVCAGPEVTSLAALVRAAGCR
jgi:SRSO17 transposase